jgi:hypothetical protein
MRRAEKEIVDRREMERILEEAEVGRLGTSVNDEPYVVPVSFAYRDGKILLHCARHGKKLDNISKNPRVCFEVDDGELIRKDKPCDFSVRYRSVIAHGDATVHTDPERMLHTLKALTDKYAPGGLSRQLTTDTITSFGDLAVVEITVSEMTGKRSP